MSVFPDCQGTVFQKPRSHRLCTFLSGNEKEECDLWIIQVGGNVSVKVILWFGNVFQVQKKWYLILNGFSGLRQTTNCLGNSEGVISITPLRNTAHLANAPSPCIRRVKSWLSVSSSCVLSRLPPPPPPGTAGHLLLLSVPGWGFSHP